MHHPRPCLQVEPAAEVDEIVGADRHQAAARSGLGGAVRHGVQGVDGDRAAAEPAFDDRALEPADRDLRIDSPDDDPYTPGYRMARSEWYGKFVLIIPVR